MHLLRLYGALVSMSLRRQLSFRTDLAFEVIATVATVASSAAAVLVLFTRVDTIGGFSPAAAILLLGTFHIVTGLRRALVEPNLRFIAGDVGDGSFDEQLLQPAPILFLVSLGGVAPLALSQTLIGIVAAVLGVSRLDRAPSVPLIGCWLLMIISAAVIMWATRCLIAATVFFSLGLTLDVAYDAVWQTAPYPTTIFARPVRFVLTYLLPVAFLATVPAAVLAGTLSPWWTLTGPAVAVISSAAAVSIWRVGLSRYTSATS
ncbi:ABC transporter permease [Microlunatus soli]|uniref:ABC-2 type transport system permease protein n=1 Tax=Microlunatus soli TaxID=630515 RepID=A0A1H1UG33_9ACTN|nr:ABC-2 family transporter protein [Microlunatus soli]SDS71485.1 ABC-2 type transport system permease protein [Microlunatus soli]